VEQDSPRLLGRRGLDPAQVDEALNSVLSQIEREESARAEVDKRIDRITRELTETRSALKRATAKPSFSDLGAAFEQTLRVAEEQAGKLLADAHSSSSEVRTSAQEEADRVTKTADEQAAKLISDAENRVAVLTAESEKKFADQLRAAENQVKLADEQLAEAQKLAEAIATEGEQKRRSLENDLANETETARNEIATLRQLHEREQRRIADEIETLRQRADRDSARLANENETYIQQLLGDAQAQVDETSKRSREALSEAQEAYAKTRQQGISMVREARETAQGILTRARARVATLTERLDERTNILLGVGESRIDDLSLEREAVEAFNSELRIISLAERPVDDATLPTTLTDAEEFDLAQAVAAELDAAEGDAQEEEQA
jgi:cell division septum initiation protein DivIVA